MPKATRLVTVLITSKLMKPSLSQLGASPLERASKKQICKLHSETTHHNTTRKGVEAYGGNRLGGMTRALMGLTEANP